MATKEKIFIPNYISDATFRPARVLPRVFFYNGLKDCETYFINSEGTAIEFNKFPYFDNYSGNVTTQDSISLLFNNEVAPYGEIPSASLYTEYWERYVELLYNPRTRLINGSAIIPLADYFQLELNDIISFRGNYYHLRAINDYNLKTGECNIQLLGPILDDALQNIFVVTGGGSSGGNGTNGTSGTSGTGGEQGTNGTNGTEGTNGTTGEGGEGTSGTEGTEGTSGTEGTNGTSGEDICVTNFGAAMTPCFGGTADEYMEGFVDLSAPTPTDAVFTLEVGYIAGSNIADCSGPNDFINLVVTVFAGDSQGLLTCNDAPFIDFDGATICSVVITDGPYIECV